MRFAKTFNVIAEQRHEVQVLVYMSEASAYERAAEHLEEWVVVAITRTPRGTWVHAEKPMASEEQAEQFIIDFNEVEAWNFAAKLMI